MRQFVLVPSDQVINV